MIIYLVTFSRGKIGSGYFGFFFSLKNFSVYVEHSQVPSFKRFSILILYIVISSTSQSKITESQCRISLCCINTAFAKNRKTIQNVRLFIKNMLSAVSTRLTSGFSKLISIISLTYPKKAPVKRS